MESWQTLSRAVIVNHSKFLSVETHAVRLPDGRIIEDWPWVITPEFANVVAVTPDQKFICFWQTKYAVSGLTLAPVGGYLEPGEEPLTAAQRELREEAGYESDHWLALGAYPVDGNRGSGVGHFFLARAARPALGQIKDDLEEQRLVLLSRAEIEQALRAGQFKVMSWAAVVALALIHLDKQP
jgi:ADP-ribose pyrophosphatase